MDRFTIHLKHIPKMLFYLTRCEYFTLGKFCFWKIFLYYSR